MACAGLLALCAAPAAFAQNASQSAGQGEVGSDPVEASRQAFNAMPQKEREALQDALVWTGDYKGSIDGEFGRMTYRAISGFERTVRGSRNDGLLDARERRELERRAARARRAVNFRIVKEPKAGVTIGVPMRLFSKREDLRGGASWSMARGNARLETYWWPESQQNLQRAYDELTAGGPGRRIVYRVLRDDFLVVSAVTNSRISYTRIARGEVGGKSILRGFTLTYPRSMQERFATLSIAISNSFDPFGKAPATAQNTGRPDKTGQPDATPAGPSVRASALAVGGNRYIAVLPAPACEGLRVGDAPGRIVRRGDAGLALIEAGPGKPASPGAPAPAEGDAIVLFADSPAPGKAQLSLGTGVLAGAGGKSARLRAALPVTATGGIVLTRSGGFAGMIGRTAPGPRKVAGPVPPASRILVPASKVLAFARAGGAEMAEAAPVLRDASVGQLAGRLRGAVRPVWCNP